MRKSRLVPISYVLAFRISDQLFYSGFWFSVFLVLSKSKLRRNICLFRFRFCFTYDSALCSTKIYLTDSFCFNILIPAFLLITFGYFPVFQRTFLHFQSKYNFCVLKLHVSLFDSFVCPPLCCCSETVFVSSVISQLLINFYAIPYAVAAFFSLSNESVGKRYSEQSICCLCSHLQRYLSVSCLFRLQIL